MGKVISIGAGEFKFHSLTGRHGEPVRVGVLMVERIAVDHLLPVDALTKKQLLAIVTDWMRLRDEADINEVTGER